MTTENAELLEPFRKYLKVLEELQLDHRPGEKSDSSDSISQNALSSSSAIGEVQKKDSGVIAARLRRILAQTLGNALKHYERDKQGRDRARSSEKEIDRTIGLNDILNVHQVSPNRQTGPNKELLRLVETLSYLPDKIREVVILKLCQGLPLPQIAERTGRSVPDVASMLRKGLEELTERMDKE